MVEELLEEAKKHRKVIKYSSSEYFYRGFKLIVSKDGLTLLDVRKKDFYSEVSRKDRGMFKSHGFVKGADLIMAERDRRRVRSYLKKLEKSYSDRNLYQEKFDERPIFYAKKLRNTKENIKRYKDLVFFYNTRRHQIESKYNLKRE